MDEPVYKIITEEGIDLDEIRELFKEYEKALGENLCFQSFEEELKDPLSLYGSPSGTLILVSNNGEPVGCIALKKLKEPGTCEMKRLYVKSKMRGKGIGEKLVTMLLGKAKELGYIKMKLDTLQRLQSAIKLYKAYGFSDASAYYPNPLNNVVYMEKELV